jgi:hypothetical protein
MIINVSPIVFLDLWLEKILYLEMMFQSEISYWAFGGLTAHSFEGGFNPEENSLLGKKIHSLGQ